MTGNYTYTIRPLCPFHIGNGQTLRPAEYVIDRDNSEVVRVDLEGMASEPRFPFDRFINSVKQQDFNLGKDYLRVALKHPSYTLCAHDNLGELLKVAGRPASHILQYVKEGGKAYIPGSSIKGALRGTILRFLLNESLPVYQEEIKRNLQVIYAGRRARREFFSSNAEKLILGDPNHTLLKALQVGDSAEVEHLSLACVKVLSLSPHGYRWKVLGTENNLDSYEEATPVFFEAIPAGAIVSGRFKIDRDLLKPQMGRALGITDKKKIALTDLPAICRKDAEAILDKEKKFFDEINFKPGIKSVASLLKELASCRDHETLLSMSWGSGYLPKTATWKLDGELVDEIRKSFQLGRREYQFPKSRKIHFAQGEPSGLVGWVKLTLQEVE